MSDGNGGPWWRPARLDDVHATPDRVLTLFRYYRLGQLARDQFEWWRASDTGRPELSHLYAVTLAGPPESAARCGKPAPAGAAERTGGEGPCPFCYRIENPHSGPGQVGTLRITADQE